MVVTTGPPAQPNCVDMIRVVDHTLALPRLVYIVWSGGKRGKIPHQKSVKGVFYHFPPLPAVLGTGVGGLAQKGAASGR